MASVINMNRVTTSLKIKGLTWDAWWQIFLTLARFNEVKLGKREEYFEYWEDGDAPEAALDMETK